MKVALIFDALRPDTTGTYFARAFNQVGVAFDHFPLKQLESIPSGYDWHLRIDHGDDYEVRWPDRLRPVSFYAIDTHLAHSWKKVQRVAPWYDQVFCCHREAAERLREAEWVPVGCDPEIHAPSGGAVEWDVGFVGTDGGVPRKFYLQALRERYPNSRIGTGDYRQMSGVYSRSRVSFNYSIRDDVNMRVFEALASGGCLVTNRLANDDYARLGLADNEHFVLYDPGTDVFAKIDALLKDPSRREKLAKNGRAAVLAAHTYKHRLERMMELANSRFGWRRVPV